jgi:hypothetical protein
VVPGVSLVVLAEGADVSPAKGVDVVDVVVVVVAGGVVVAVVVAGGVVVVVDVVVVGVDVVVVGVVDTTGAVELDGADAAMFTVAVAAEPTA